MRHSYQIHETGYKSATHYMSSSQTPAARLGGLVLKMVAIKLLLLAVLTMAGVDIYPAIMSAIRWLMGV